MLSKKKFFKPKIRKKKEAKRDYDKNKIIKIVIKVTLSLIEEITLYFFS